MLTEWTKNQILDEFKGIMPEPNYNGGCKKTHCLRFCALLKTDGKVGSIRENCKYHDTCNGLEATYKI